MKKLIYILLPILFIGFFQSCLFEEDDVFDDSAANRMTKAIADYKQILTSAPNGWLMEYYAEKEPKKMGGYNFICYFDKSGKVTLSTDTKIAGILPGQTETSEYSVIGDAGPVLSFDSNNKLLHYFSEPSKGDVNGFEGDFEFMMMEVSSEKITMHGKKNKNRIVMTPLPEGLDAQDYLEKTAEMVFNTLKIFPYTKVIVNGTEAATTTCNRYKYYTFTTIGGETITQNVIYNPEGMKFFDPVTVGGVTFQNFKWIPPTAPDGFGTWECTDKGVDVKLETYYPAGHMKIEDYFGKWTMSYKNRTEAVKSRVVTIAELEKNDTYSLSNFFPIALPVTLEYELGALRLASQNLGIIESTKHDYSLYLWSAYNGSSYYFSNGTYIGAPVSVTDRTIVFTKETNSVSGIGLIIIYIHGTNGGVYYYGADASYAEIKLTKVP